MLSVADRCVKVFIPAQSSSAIRCISVMTPSSAARRELKSGRGTLLAHCVQVFDNNSHSARFRLARAGPSDRGRGRKRPARAASPMRQLTLANTVWIGFDSIVFKGVRIGKGSVVARAAS
jgi:acetyltransferase-like isoleucine patch superfamily enzyme